MRIARLRLKNWMAYRGEHELVLGPKVYAIVARLREDPERSNWLCKTGLVEAVRFVLYGDHRFRTDDEWISEGESRGEAEIEFDDGARAVRSRDRGKKGSLFYYPPGDPAGAMLKDEAQEEIVRRVGLSKEDFEHTCYFPQKKLSQFVTAEAADRMKIVSAWFRLEPLEECERRTKELAADLEADVKKAEGHLTALADREAAIAGKDPEGKPAWTREAISAAIPRAEAEVERLRGVVAALEQDLEKNAALLAGKRHVDDYAQVVNDGIATRADLEKRRLPVLKEAWEKANAAASAAAVEVGAAARDVAAKRQVARGEFDGRCPVAGIGCPAKDAINADGAKGREALSAAEAAHRARREALAALEAASATASAELQAAQRVEQRLLALRDQASKLAPLAKAAKSAGEPEDPTVLRGRLDVKRGEMYDAQRALDQLRAWARELDGIVATRATLKENLRGIEEKVGVFREAAVIFGKRGAQRRVSEGALSAIEERANKVLRSSGADNSIRVAWSREGKGVATSCDACGHPFPSSVKVKHCERCGAPRGPKLENKLLLEIARQSGAAEDLAGAGFQLAASRWLRESRGTAWSTALLDEPFGALDAAHRKGFAAHLTAMLSGEYGFEQAFVVAHHASILDALPGRIEIVSDGRWSVPRVVA